MISSVLSQQRLNDSTVIVPIQSLKNALLVKADRDNLKTQLGITRDSIKYMDTIILRQDNTIHVCDSTRLLLDSQILDYKGTIVAKDGIINEQNNKIINLTNKLTGAIITLTISTVGFILLLL
jgi:prophage DNA circulation protein